MNKMIYATYTKEQIAGLLKNKNVLKFTGKYIAYTPDFKIRAVDKYLNEGMMPNEIFRQAGFDFQVIGRYKASYLVYGWIKVFKARGNEGFMTEQRGWNGGRPKIIESLTDEEKIKRLELEIQYLKKENDFLVKLRARRSE